MLPSSMCPFPGTGRTGAHHSLRGLKTGRLIEASAGLRIPKQLDLLKPAVELDSGSRRDEMLPPPGNGTSQPRDRLVWRPAIPWPSRGRRRSRRCPPVALTANFGLVGQASDRGNGYVP